jgi:hypothetical protein
MPYFKNDKINLLFIHIPKTGGSSVEHYLSKQFNIPLNNSSLYKTIGKTNFTFQHLSLNNIYLNQTSLNIDFKDPTLRILTVVRNPYDRCISSLFYNKLIQSDTTPEKVYQILKNLLPTFRFDRHYVPQYLFLECLSLQNHITIIKTESLTQDMHGLGFINFVHHSNKNRYDVTNYDQFLNSDSIRLINKLYDRDFVMFEYTKKNLNGKASS